MKFTLAILSALTISANAGTLGQGHTCWVQFVDQGREGKYIDYGDDSCDKSSLDCNYQIGDDGHATEPIAGTCEPKKCLGTNSNKPPGSGTDRITICHRTCSTTNPWVRVTIDRNGWDDTESGCGHGPQHDIWDDCKATELEAKEVWGAESDFIMKEHGTRDQVLTMLSTQYGKEITESSDEYKAYWAIWEKACPFVRNGQCCDMAKGECCGFSPEQSDNGGDPHFARWHQKHDTFHGECDLVLAKSESFLDGAGLDVHVRTTMHSYYSYIETAAIRVGGNKMEFYNDHFFVGDAMYTEDDLPLSLSEGAKVTITKYEQDKNPKYNKAYQVHMGGSSSFILNFYKQFMTIKVIGEARDFGDSMGLLGDYYTGDMVARDGRIMNDFQDFAFEWQVNPDDKMIFREARAPQLPFEQCRMPTEARPSRRALRADADFYKKAAAACAHASDVELCVDDVMMTKDLGFAQAW